MSYKLYFDGACLPVNPNGICVSGFCLMEDKDIIGSNCEVVKEKGTNNFAEYMGVILGLEEIVKRNIKKINIYGDSALVVNQLNGTWAVKSDNIVPLVNRADLLLRKINKYSLKWVPREKNKIADRLVHETYINYAEQESLNRSKKISFANIKEIDVSKFIVSGTDDYFVDIRNNTCTCPHFKRINSYYLLRRSNITLRCKHILRVIEKIGSKT